MGVVALPWTQTPNHTAEDPVPHKPSVVYLTGDCLKASATPMLGNRACSAPFMERMAAQGATFTQAYSPNPICSPSRASVFTGVHPLVHQVTCHQNRAPLNLPQLSELFQDAGYYTAAAGHYELIRGLGRGWTEQVDEATRGPLLDSYLTWQRSGRRDIGWPSGRLPVPAEESHSHLLTDRVMPLLDSAKTTGAPFFLHVSYNDPHSPTFAPPPYDSLIDPDAVPLPPAGDSVGQPVWHQDAHQVFRTAEATESDLRKLVSVYYGMIAHLDRQMERVHEGLKARNLLDDAWFIIASDHGDYTGEKGLFSHTESLYECLLHVPLIIVPPAGAHHGRGRKIDALVDLVDLFPTMLGMAGIETPYYAQGHDLVAWLKEGNRQPLRDCVFAQVGDYHGHLGDSLPGGRPGCTRHPSLLEGVRSRDFSYTRDPDFGDEAYDLRRDPCELSNLLNPGRRSAPDEVDALRRCVDDWHEECLRVRDEFGVIPGHRGFDKGWE